VPSRAAFVVVLLLTTSGETTRPIACQDAGPLRARLEADGITQDGFASYVRRLHESNLQRVHEGDLDHLVFYLLQSTHFTPAPRVEPALSAKTFVATSEIQASVRSRVTALLRAVDSSDRDPRLSYFRSLIETTFPDRARRADALLREYERVMKFVYEKEPVGCDAVAALYRTRGLSTDTAVESGFLVYQGLGVLRSLDPDRRVRRVLIVGPGLDLAPRTGLLESASPESYQPWAVMDALLRLGLSRVDDLEVFAADINPRVVAHIERSREAPPVLTLVTGVRESDTLTFADDYRAYFGQLGTAVGLEQGASPTSVSTGHLAKIIRTRADVARALRPQALDIVTERLNGAPFDLIVATNILPYFDDDGLMLAMANVSAMLAVNGAFLHNEARPLIGEVSRLLGLPAVHSRHAIIATVRGAPAPLGDSIWLHLRGEESGIRKQEE